MHVVHQLAAAAVLLTLTLLLQAAGVTAMIEWLRRVVAQNAKFGLVRSAALVVQTASAIICLHGLIILLWAGFYRLRCFPTWEIAFYFSASSYVTVGYGDVVLPLSWRLLGPLESMTGVLMCGISIGVLIALVTRLVDRNEQQAAVAGKRSDYSRTSYTSDLAYREQSRA
jgi:voltage-gated potassium channel